MSNKVVDPGFEDNDPAWTFVKQDAANFCGRSTEAAYEDTWGCRITHWANTNPTIIGQYLYLPTLDLHDFSWWMRIWDIPSSGRDDFFLKAYLFPHIIDPVTDYVGYIGTEFYSDSWTADGDIPETWSQFNSGLVEPTSANVTLIIVAEHSASPAPLDPVGWYFDTFSCLTELELRGYTDRASPVDPTYNPVSAKSISVNPAETPGSPVYTERSNNDPSYS